MTVAILIWVLSAVLVILCGIIVFLILGQDVRGGGLAGALGGGSVQSAFGSRTTEAVIKLTAYLLAAILVLVVVLINLYTMKNKATGPLGGGTTTSVPYDSSPITPGPTPTPTPTPMTPTTP